MIDGGYYIKARKIQNSDISTAAPYVREIWDWLIKEANHTETPHIKRGQMVRTFNDIIDGLKWFVGYRKMTYKKWQCENAMRWLVKHEMITTMKTTRGLVITICNYDIYQNPKNYENNNRSITKPTKEQQTTDTINNKDKQLKEIPKYFLEAAKYYYDTYNKKYPNITKGIIPDVEKSAEVLYELNRLDGFKEEEIGKVLRFILEDDFWHQQVVSLCGLRKKGSGNLTKFVNARIKMLGGKDE